MTDQRDKLARDLERIAKTLRQGGPVALVAVFITPTRYTEIITCSDAPLAAECSCRLQLMAPTVAMQGLPETWEIPCVDDSVKFD